MKTQKRLVMQAVVASAVVVLAFNAKADIRPVGDVTQLAQLQTLFNDIGATSIDAVNDQIPETAFEPTGTGNSVASYVATISYVTSDIEFGIYDQADPNTKVTMFNYYASTPGDVTYLQFSLGGDYVRSVNAQTLTVVDSSTYFKQFGFFATSSYGTYYSEDYLNPASAAHMLSYEAEGDLVTIGGGDEYNDFGHYYVASEVTPINGNSDDYTDLVVQMESMIPIPEPASAVLIVGASSLIFYVRKRFII